MSVHPQSLESQLAKTGTNLNSEKEELQKLEHKYALTRKEWEGTIYQVKEENHQEIILEDRGTSQYTSAKRCVSGGLLPKAA